MIQIFGKDTYYLLKYISIMSFFCIIYEEIEKNARFVLLSEIKLLILQPN